MRKQTIPFQMIEEEALILNHQNSKVHELNSTACKIWSTLKSPHTLDELTAILEKTFCNPPGELRSDIEKFVLDLKQENLLETLD